MIRRFLDRLYLFSGYLAGVFLIVIFVLMMLLSAGRPTGLNIPAGDDFTAFPAHRRSHDSLPDGAPPLPQRMQRQTLIDKGLKIVQPQHLRCRTTRWHLPGHDRLT